jgi:hypothetical protein
MKVAGPGDTPSRRKIFICQPVDVKDEAGCARKIILALARQAYRRPVNEDEIEDLMNLYRSGSGGFEYGIRVALQAILSNPGFLFRFERVPPNAPQGPYRISDLELASRLSYFIWSAGPDEELLSLATQGKLKEPAILDKQTRRMLADRKASALTNNFASQWLHLRNLKEAQPDAYQYLGFTKNLADSMMRETQLFFDSIVREDRSVLDLLTADYTFVDELLAKHYGISNVSGSAFRRVQISDKNRHGILGHASILTLTSVSTRTSPVGRGKYVMEVFFGTPPPPPPPNVPALKENATSGDARILSVRQRIEEHRANEPCSSCHKLMDPIGLSLENFDAVGAWRINDGGSRIDSRAELFDGTELDGPASLNQAILKHSDMFLAAFAENLIAYGLGRVVDYRDMPVLRSIVNDAAKNEYRFSSFVLALVKSAPFRMSEAEEGTAVLK